MLRIISGLLLLELSTFLLGLGSSIYLGYAQMVDAEGLVYEEDEEDGIVNEDLRVWCSRNRTWRSAGTLHKLLPNTMTITQYVKGLYWFSEGISDKNARKQSGLSVKAWRKLSTEIRLLMFQDIENLQRTLPRLGGPGCFVAIDECYFTKRKQVKGGFQGRRTIGNKTCVLGMVEVDLQTRRATGNIRLLIIPGAKVPAIKRAITDHVVQGSLVFTDRHQSYQWMARPGSGYVHRCVNHRAREFHRVETIFIFLRSIFCSIEFLRIPKIAKVVLISALLRYTFRFSQNFVPSSSNFDEKNKKIEFFYVFNFFQILINLCSDF